MCYSIKKQITLVLKRPASVYAGCIEGRRRAMIVDPFKNYSLGETATSIMIILATLFLLRYFWKLIRSREEPIAKEIILITGGAQGIGKELALQYGQQGGRIISVDVNESKNEETVQELKAQNIEAYAYTCNVTKLEEIRALQERIERDIGPVSIVVANAGMAIGASSLEAINEQDFKAVFDLNFFSAFWLLKVFLPGMMKRNKGHIVTISSITGLTPLPGISAYSCTKKAVAYLMRAAREEMELAKKNVKFTTIYPDFTETNLTKAVWKFMPSMLTVKEVAAATIKAHKKGATDASIPWHYLPLSKLLDILSVSGLYINYWASKLGGNQRNYVKVLEGFIAQQHRKNEG